MLAVEAGNANRVERLPAATDYAVALADPTRAFERPELQQAVFTRGPLGVRVMPGEHAVVARAKVGGHETALRFHLKDDPLLAARYRVVDEHLAKLGANAPAAICRATYTERGILVGGVWRPMSTMDWVAGPRLRDFAEKRLQQPEELRALAEQWAQVARDLRSAEYVHLDLSHNNIVITPNGIRLIDPDVAWVPELGDEFPPESGNPAFQHPGRAKAKSSLDLDNFSNIVIYLSLRALAADPSLWKYSASERLILDARDYAQPNLSPAFTQMLGSPDAEVRALTAKLMQLCLGDITQVPALDDLLRSGREIVVASDQFEKSPASNPFTVSNARRASWLAAYLPKENRRSP